MIRSYRAIALTSVMSEVVRDVCDDAHGKGERARDLENDFIWEKSTKQVVNVYRCWSQVFHENTRNGKRKDLPC